MAIGLMNRIWWREDLDSSEKLVLLALADRSDDEGVCWYAIETICRKSSLSRRGVQKVIARLCEKGLLRKVHRHDLSNFYVIPIDKFPHVADVTRPSKEKGALQYIEEEPDLFDRGERSAPRRGERGSDRGERGAIRGEPGAPDSLSGSLNDSIPDAQAREGDETIEQMIFRVWNDIASINDKLAPIARLTETRQKAIAARTKEWVRKDRADPDWRNDRDVWTHVFRVIVSSKLLSGKKLDWAPSFDWILGPKNFTKIMEGNYGHGHDKIGSPTAGDRSAVSAGRAARELVERGRRRTEADRSAGYSEGVAGADR